MCADRIESMIPLSILDLAPIVEGGDAAQALRNTLDLAQHAERLGYTRYWLAEHHNMRGHRQRRDLGGDRPRGRRHLDDPRRRRRHHAAEPLAAGDRRAVRHAGIALPGPHRPRPRPRARAPTSSPRARCAATWSDRRRLPAGRARAAGATRPGRAGPARSAPCPAPARTCRSGSSARASSARSSPPMLGLPYAFASHFAPDALLPALEVYRSDFQPSAQLADALRHGRRQRDRRRHRRRGARASSPRCSRPSPTCARTAAGRCRRRSTTSSTYWSPRRRTQRRAC